MADIQCETSFQSNLFRSCKGLFFLWLQYCKNSRNNEDKKKLKTVLFFRMSTKIFPGECYMMTVHCRPQLTYTECECGGEQ